jgi:hypothetical protein
MKSGLHQRRLQAAVAAVEIPEHRQLVAGRVGRRDDVHVPVEERLASGEVLHRVRAFELALAARALVLEDLDHLHEAQHVVVELLLQHLGIARIVPLELGERGVIGVGARPLDRGVEVGDVAAFSRSLLSTSM